MPDWKQFIRARLTSANLDPMREGEIADELAQHLDDLYQDLQASGLADEECLRLALAELQEGDLLAAIVSSVKRRRAPAETLRMRSHKSRFLPGLAQDLKIAFRNLRTKPLFSMMVIGLLALGIAGNAVVFSVFDGLFLRPLPFAEPDRLVDLDETAPRWNLQYVGVSNLDLYQWRKDNSTFDVMAFYRDSNFNLSGPDAAQRVEDAQVTREMLDVLRLKPLLGRNFNAEEDSPGGAKVVLLNYGFWVQNFQRDPHVLGQVLELDKEPYTVIGVLPPEAVFPNRAKLWIPLAADPNVPAGYYVTGVGRLKPGVSIEQAQADLLRIHKAMVPEHRVNEITSPILTSLGDRYVGTFKTAGFVLLGAVGLVLLIACVNIAALIMVRGAYRAREMAIRAAIGATQARIVTQLLTENLVLAAIGGFAGVALGEACLRVIVPLLASQVPAWVRFSIDARFAAFCLAITAASVLLFGLAPSLQAARVDIRGALSDAAVRTTPSRTQRTTLAALVVCEIGLALTLSISAGLLVQAFRKVLQVDPGFRPENVVTFLVGLPEASYAKPEQRVAYYERLLAKLRALPGVKAASVTSAPPLGGHWGGVFEAEGVNAGRQNENPTVLQVAVSPGYFEAIGMTLLAGRTFTEQDTQPSAPMVAIVNESFAKHFWGTESPLGKRIRRPGPKDSGPLFNSSFEVVGLLRDEKHDGFDQKAGPSVFLPYAKVALAADKNDARSLREMNIVLRGSIDPNILTEPARAIVHELDPGVPMYGVRTMAEQIDRSLWARRAYSWLFGGFAIVAILLSAAGVYGIVSYAVSQRTQEIGIRMAVGARPGQVLLEVLRGGMSLVGIGVAAGIVGALVATRLLRTLLFGVSSHDPLIYAVVAGGVIVIGLLANLIPARRAAAVDPMRALHVQ
jgi:predicted permease